MSSSSVSLAPETAVFRRVVRRARHESAFAQIGILSIACLVPQASSLAQLAMPFLLGVPPMEARATAPVASREPWTLADRTAVTRDAIAAASALPDRLRSQARLRLATALGQAGDLAAEAAVLRQAADDPHRIGAPLRDLASRLVAAGEIDAARKLASDLGDPDQKRQVMSGILEGATRAGDLDAGLDVLRAERRLPRQRADTFAIQARSLAASLAKAGRYRDALAAYPPETSGFDPTSLPDIAAKACAADPSLAGEAGHRLAAAALRTAADRFSMRPPFDALRAFRSCKGEAAAAALIGLMTPDVADRLKAGETTAVVVVPPREPAREAVAAARKGDAAAADRLFAEAMSRLDAGFAQRSASVAARRDFDVAVDQVATSLQSADRTGAALSLVARLSPVERLPILFKLAGDTVRAGGDPQASIAAIDATFAMEPVLVEIEADAIRSLRAALPLGSPAYPLIEPWLRALPEDAAPVVPNQGDRRLSNVARPFDAIMLAIEGVAPSVATTRKVLTEARRGDVALAIADAKAMTLTPRESAVLEMARDFVKALPDELVTPYQAMAGLEGLDPKDGLATSAADGLLVAVERSALARGNAAGARDALAALDPASPLKAYAAASLASWEARVGLPLKASADLKDVRDPYGRFLILVALVTVKPST